MNVVFDANSAHAPITLQDISINILARFMRLQERVNDKTTEVDLQGKATKKTLVTGKEFRRLERGILLLAQR